MNTAVATQSPNPIRVLVVDDHELVRKGICSLIKRHAGVEVVAEANDGKEALEQIRVSRPDVVLMDLIMPELTGVEATRAALESWPDVRVLILTASIDEARVLPALEAGARGYILKSATPSMLIDSIRRVHRNEPALPEDVTKTLLDQLSRRARPGGTITGREAEVLRLIGEGKSNREVAELLNIREATARTHVSRIMTKIGVSTRTAAALYAVREGYASLPAENALPDH